MFRLRRTMMAVQMMKKAEEATTQAQQLLQKSLQNWLPGWLEVQYDKVMTSSILCCVFCSSPCPAS